LLDFQVVLELSQLIDYSEDIYLNLIFEGLRFIFEVKMIK